MFPARITALSTRISLRPFIAAILASKFKTIKSNSQNWSKRADCRETSFEMHNKKRAVCFVYHQQYPTRLIFINTNSSLFPNEKIRVLKPSRLISVKDIPMTI